MEWCRLLVQVNESANRAKTTARRIISAKSEAAMARTASGKLSSKRRVLAKALTSAEARLTAGQAPTADAEREWERLAELDRLHEAHADPEVSDHCSVDVRPATVLMYVWRNIIGLTRQLAGGGGCL